MNNEKNEKPKDNNPKPTTFKPGKKVFDVVRPGKSPAAPNSRSVIVGHKPQIADDQFVPSPNTRLAGNPSEKRPLMDPDKKVGVAPMSGDKEPSAPTPVSAANDIPASKAVSDSATDITPDSIGDPAKTTSAEAKLEEEVAEFFPPTDTAPEMPADEPGKP